MLFDHKIKKGFRKVRKDISEIRNSVNEWVFHMNGSQKEMEQKIIALEKRIKRIETESMLKARKIDEEIDF